MNWKNLILEPKRIMTGVAVLALCSAMFSPLALANDHSKADTKIYQVIDGDNTAKLPKEFRTTNDPLKSASPMPSTEGMAKLNASGSGSLSENGLKTIKAKLGNKKVIVVDLREESHLAVNGIPITWFAPYDWVNVGKSRDDIEKDEKEKQEKLIKEGKATFYNIIKKGPNGTLAEVQPVELKIDNVKTEKELVKSVGYDYFRITCTDHCRPQDKDVDRFVELVREMDDNTWLHFHCRGGQGRTSTFMVLNDMMHNAKNVSINDIDRRQILIGGDDDLFNLDPSDDPVKYKSAQERLVFLKKFYEYCKTNKDGFKTSWSDWSKAHK